MTGAAAPVSEPGPPSLTGTLAAWAVGVRAQGAGAPAREEARALVQDWLGCALAGLGTPAGRMFLDHARSEGAGACTALGRDGLPPQAAARLNGALSHIVEMDDVERASVLHPGTVVIPAALAAAESAGASAEAFLDAVVAGFEVMVRVGRAVGRRHYLHFHNTATCGPFGSAVAAGLLLGLDREQLAWALGNAGTLAAGLWQFNLDGALSKPLHAGQAAGTGVLVAQLAARGLTGAAHILEGEHGFFAALAPQGDPAVVTQDLGSAPLAVHGISLKPHASCRHTHAAVDAALAVRERLAGAPPAQVRVQVYRTALDVCDRPAPQTSAQAKFSLQFCVASALARGHAGLQAFEGTGLDDAQVRALAAGMTVSEDPARTAAYPAQWSAQVTVRDAAGREHVAEQRFPLGDPEAPLDGAQRARKFDALLAYAGLEAHAPALRAWLDGLHGDRPLRGPTVRVGA